MKMYNFKNVENIESFLNEIGANIELKLKESNDCFVEMTNEFGDSDYFLSFNELNNYANEQLSVLVQSGLNKELVEELIEEFTF